MDNSTPNVAEIAVQIGCGNELIIIALCIIPAYLFGSIPFGLLLSKIFGYGDIRKIGSGNIGATNALRTGNKKLAILTLTLDAGKGAAVITFASFLIKLDCDYLPHNSGLLLLGLSSILGHCFPVWLKFKGGKGVATTLGVLLTAVPFAGLAACITWLLVAFTFRLSSLSALMAITVASIVTLFVYQSSAEICIVIAAIVFIRHRENIKRLFKGVEPKIGQKKKLEKENGDTKPK